MTQEILLTTSAKLVVQYRILSKEILIQINENSRSRKKYSSGNATFDTLPNKLSDFALLTIASKFYTISFLRDYA